MRRVLDALLDGQPAPPDAQAALSDAEQAQVAALARTAQVTRLTLQRPEPTAEIEQRSFDRVQQALATGASRPVPSGTPPERHSWWDRLTRLWRNND